MNRVLLLFVFLVGCSRTELVYNPCLPDEKVVFSGAPLCEPNNAISVCLDKGGNNTVRYRNMDETLIEFDADVRKCAVAYSGGGGIHLTFTNEEDSFEWWSVHTRGNNSLNNDKGWIFKKDGVAAPSPTQCSLTGKPQLTSVTFDDQYLPPVEEWNCEGLWW